VSIFDESRWTLRSPVVPDEGRRQAVGSDPNVVSLACAIGDTGKTPHAGVSSAVASHARKRRDAETRTAEWIDRQIASSPPLSDHQWRAITRIVQRQTTSMRSGENRPPLTAAGLTTTATRIDSIIARR
jgi:hypothetical protein